MERFFKDRFQSHELPPDPALWVALSGRLGLASRKRRFLPIVLVAVFVSINPKHQLVLTQPILEDLRPYQVLSDKSQLPLLKIGEKEIETSLTSHPSKNQAQVEPNLPIDSTDSESFLQVHSKAQTLERNFNFSDKSLEINDVDTFLIDWPNYKLQSFIFSKPNHKWKIGVFFRTNLSYYNLKLEGPIYGWEKSQNPDFHRRIGLTTGFLVGTRVAKNFDLALLAQLSLLNGSAEYHNFESSSNFSFDANSESLLFNPSTEQKSFNLTTYSPGLQCQYRFKNRYAIAISAQYHCNLRGFNTFAFEAQVSKPILSSTSLKADLSATFTAMRRDFKIVGSPVSVLPYYFGLGLNFYKP